VWDEAMIECLSCIVESWFCLFSEMVYEAEEKKEEKEEEEEKEQQQQ
jgi:hypothetical protein